MRTSSWWRRAWGRTCPQQPRRAVLACSRSPTRTRSPAHVQFYDLDMCTAIMSGVKLFAANGVHFWKKWRLSTHLYDLAPRKNEIKLDNFDTFRWKIHWKCSRMVQESLKTAQYLPQKSTLLVSKCVGFVDLMGLTSILVPVNNSSSQKTIEILNNPKRILSNPQ